MKKIIQLLIIFIPLSCFVSRNDLFAQTPELVIPSGLKEIGGIYHVNITPDQQKLVAVAGKSIQVYGYVSGILFKTIVANGSMSKVSFSPDRQVIFMEMTAC